MRMSYLLSLISRVAVKDPLLIILVRSSLLLEALNLLIISKYIPSKSLGDKSMTNLAGEVGAATTIDEAVGAATTIDEAVGAATTIDEAVGVT